jgi:hypothetical protein
MGARKRSRLVVTPMNSAAQQKAMKKSSKHRAPKRKPVRIAQHGEPKITG